MNPQPRSLMLTLTTLAALLFAAGCDKNPQTPQANNGANNPPAVKPMAAPPTPEVLAKLATADAVDGKTDKVVEKCPACDLGMPGKPEHELVVGDYKLHFCNADQEKAFAADPNAKILAMKMPAK